MARLPRYVLPGQPQHIIQRGNNRQVIFASDTDFQFFRDAMVRLRISTVLRFMRTCGWAITSICWRRRSTSRASVKFFNRWAASMCSTSTPPISALARSGTGATGRRWWTAAVSADGHALHRVEPPPRGAYGTPARLPVVELRAQCGGRYRRELRLDHTAPSVSANRAKCGGATERVSGTIQDGDQQERLSANQRLHAQRLGSERGQVQGGH